MVYIEKNIDLKDAEKLLDEFIKADNIKISCLTCEKWETCGEGSFKSKLSYENGVYRLADMVPCAIIPGEEFSFEIIDVAFTDEKTVFIFIDGIEIQLEPWTEENEKSYTRRRS